MATKKTVKAGILEEAIEDRAVPGLVLEHNWDTSGIQSLHSEEPYEAALILEEYMEDTTKKKYAIYKGTASECVREHDRLSELRYTLRQSYVQSGNGTPKISTLEDDLQNVKIAQESIDRTIKTINHKSTNEYTEMLDDELGRHKANLNHIEKKIEVIIEKL